MKTPQPPPQPESPPPGPAQSLEARITTGLNKVSLALRHQAWQGAGSRRLSPTQGQILAILAGSAGLRPSDIAERLAVSLPTVSDSVRALVDKGLAAKLPDDRDGRSLRVVLTDAGRDEARQAAGWPDFLTSAVQAMSAAEQEVFFTGLVKMIRTLQQRGQIPLSRMCLTCKYFRPRVHADAERPHHCAFVDAPLGASDLRLECEDQEAADPAAQAVAWDRFTAG